METGENNRFYMMKNKKLKNPIDKIHLYLLLYELQKRDTKVSSIIEGGSFYGNNQTDVSIGS